MLVDYLLLVVVFAAEVGMSGQAALVAATDMSSLAVHDRSLPPGCSVFIGDAGVSTVGATQSCTLNKIPQAIVELLFSLLL